MSERAYRCSRCERFKPLADFPPSRAARRQWCRECFRERMGGPPTTRACDWCSTVMVVTARRAAEPRVFCSRPCQWNHRHEADKTARRLSKLPRRCPQCGADLPSSMRADAVFCSDRCLNAAHNATRKASWKIGAHQQMVSRAYIIERDGRRCHLCGKRCTRAEIHLDHLIPLSDGGTHAPENLAVACAACNLKRGAGRLPAQLRLVG